MSVEWQEDRHGSAKALLGKLVLHAWCSAPGSGIWEVTGPAVRECLLRSSVQDNIPDLDAAKAACLAAAVDFLVSALASVPVDGCDGEFVAHPGAGIVDTDEGEMSADYAIRRARALLLAAHAAKEGGQ